VKVLILGYSSIAQRRMIPALRRIAGVTSIDIASLSKPIPADLSGEAYNAYDEALQKSSAELVYVSLQNSEHARWVLAALEANKHVIVDKPAALSLVDTRLCLDMAARRSLLLAEGTLFSWHPQIAAMQSFFEVCGPLTHIDARFVIPPLPATNFRNQQALGGGCLLDMGPYAVAVARLFAKSPLTRLTAVSAPVIAGLDIDVGFSLLAQFNDGLRYTGHFSFESEYQNELLLIGKGGSISVERAFSPPADFTSLWLQRRGNHVTQVEYAPADVFHIFAQRVIDAIAAHRHESFASDMLRDAEMRAAIAGSLGYVEQSL
jgi:NDP-hexose-3-ketoreductase